MTQPTPVVDYTSRDYPAILDDLLALIPFFSPKWTSRSSSDFGIVLLELFAYASDGLHYYADRVANEAFITTATKRSSVLKIAQLLDYTPTPAAASQVSLSFTNTSATDGVVPARTAVMTVSGSLGIDVPVVFETSAAVTVLAGQIAAVLANEGRTVALEAVGVSDGTARQSMQLFQVPVIGGTISVFVNEGNLAQWDYAPHLLDNSGTSKVFGLVTNESGVVSIIFGDNVNGKAPDAGSPIFVTYRVGGGQRGNVPPNTITKIIDPVPAGLTVNNIAGANGGADAEDTDSIRENAPRSLQTLNRAVSLVDYSDLAVTFPGIAKARAISTTGTSVSMYVAPFGGGGVETGGADTAPFGSLKAALLTFLDQRKAINATVTLLSPTYVPINIEVTVQALPRYRQDRVQASCGVALANLLAFNNVIFGDFVTLSDMHASLLPVDGVSYIEVTLLDRGVGTGKTGVQLAENEIPTLGVLSVVVIGGLI